MKITVLIDNKPSDDSMLFYEHGLSFYLETEEYRILCDMGASSNFLVNAGLLNIDLSKIDFAFLSHGHADHSGGLLDYLQDFDKKCVYLSGRILDATYFSSRRGIKRDISTANKNLVPYQERLKLLDRSIWITPNVAAVYTVDFSFSQPYGNRFLTKVEDNVETLDDFSHELSLAIRTPKGLVIVSSCSHGGAINIMNSCSRFTGVDNIYAFIGGFHLVDSEHTAQEIDTFLQEVHNMYPDVLFYTGHCTCDVAKQTLQQGNANIRSFKTGTIINL